MNYIAIIIISIVILVAIVTVIVSLLGCREKKEGSFDRVVTTTETVIDINKQTQLQDTPSGSCNDILYHSSGRGGYASLEEIMYSESGIVISIPVTYS